MGCFIMTRMERLVTKDMLLFFFAIVITVLHIILLPSSALLGTLPLLGGVLSLGNNWLKGGATIVFLLYVFLVAYVIDQGDPKAFGLGVTMVVLGMFLLLLSILYVGYNIRYYDLENPPPWVKGLEWL